LLSLASAVQHHSGEKLVTAACHVRLQMINFSKVEEWSCLFSLRLAL
jgi:hypothetical protein